MIDHSVYLHVPFCVHRCGYCDFNTYAGLDALIPAYIQALRREIHFAAESAGQRIPVHTIFFGGGTPSLLPIAGLEAILESLTEAFAWQPGIEITLEANPGTLSLPYLRDLRRLGVTRLSLGMQSAHPDELRLLERQHNYSDVIQSVAWARRAGFDNLNLDLIFGLPEQPLETWRRSLELACGLHPEHFSLYSLTLEHDTPFGRWASHGLLSEPDPDTAADMYEWSTDILASLGYTQYEISNWAKQTSPHDFLACRHNLQYWRNLPYFGFGAGAHGYISGVRTANVLSPNAYIQRLQTAAEQPGCPYPQTPATLSALVIDQEAEIAETMMMGLRLLQEGVSEQRFQQRFDQSLRQRFARPIQRLIQLGLLEWAGEQQDILRITTRGRLLGNQVFVEFI